MSWGHRPWYRIVILKSSLRGPELFSYMKMIKIQPVKFFLTKIPLHIFKVFLKNWEISKFMYTCINQLEKFSFFIVEINKCSWIIVLISFIYLFVYRNHPRKFSKCQLLHEGLPKSEIRWYVFFTISDVIIKHLILFRDFEINNVGSRYMYNAF